jgi:ubiquinone/menaquinone biosynthesis C-methylase UbiE
MGALLHSALLYDFTVWLFTFGREKAFREQLLSLAHLRGGEAVLDVGCGTGTLAILARQQVGPSATVCGIDGSPEMIARARSKAKRAGAIVRFETAAAQELPFAKDSFNVALATLMLHHLGSKARADLARELRRVVQPGGRVLLVDFGSSTRGHEGFLRHFRHGHGRTDLHEMIELLCDAGFHIAESGAVGVKDLYFALGTVPHDA